MAKKSAIARNKKRERMVAQYAEKRAALKAIIANPDSTDEEFYAARDKLTKLPRNSSAIRIKNRCNVTGRPRAYIRRYGLSRLTFRELALEGKIPGVTKSSW